MNLVVILGLVGLVLSGVATAQYPASAWVADLNTQQGPANPSGFRRLPVSGFVFNSQYSGIGSLARLVLFNGNERGSFDSNWASRRA